MAKYRHSMVLGKFYPPHKGHLYLIEEAIKHCRRVTVFICTQPSEDIDGETRFSWLSKISQSRNWGITLIWVKDELPQTPEEHGDKEDFYRIWTNVVHSRQNELDVIFTSESYGDEYAEYLGLKHHLVDLERTKHNVSGTAIRNNPFDNWEHIPIEVKPYFKKKVVVMGPESTGKTTLIKRLSEHYKGDLVLEYGREFTDEIPASTMCEMDFEEIAVHHHTDIMDKVMNGEKRMVFVDTEALTTLAFAEMYLGNIGYSPPIEDCIGYQWGLFDLVLVLGIDVPWIDDGTRDFPNDRERHLKMIKDKLRGREIPYKNITGTYEERFEISKKLIDKMLG